jgi:hypothetical protein
MKTIYTILTPICALLIWLRATEVKAQLTVKPVVTHASCNGGVDGAIRLQVNGTPPYRFEWSNGAVTQDIKDLNAGPYKVKVSDDRGNVQEAEVVVSNRSSATLEKRQIVIPAEGAKNGLIEVQVTGGRAPYTFFLSDFTDLNNIKRYQQSDGAFRGLPRGRYMVDAVDANGCTSSLTVRLR